MRDENFNLNIAPILYVKLGQKSFNTTKSAYF